MREPTRIIAIRHGETAWNVDTRLQGQLDVPLNATGQSQAKRLAQSLADEPIDALYSSDLQRAASTAEAIALQCGRAVSHDVGLRERHFGIWQGQTYAEVEQHWPEQAQKWRQRLPDFGPEGGETLQAFFDRCVSTVMRLADPHPGQTVVMVAHGGVLDCLYRAASHLDLHASRTWELPNTGVNRLLYTGDGLSLVGWGDVSHLDLPVLDESSDGDR